MRPPHLIAQWLEQERVWDDLVYFTQSVPSATLMKARIDAPVVVTNFPVSGAAPIPLVSQSSIPSSNRAASLTALYEANKGCVKCSLGSSRIKFVFGVGNPEASVMFVGEGPGYEEDRRGEPFVGPAGQLLDKIIGSIGLDRKTAYIANIVKCHPMINPQLPDSRGNDRPPTPVEVDTCAPILLQQIAIIQPKVIVTLGAPSTKMILKTTEGISKIRGQLTPFPATLHQRADLELNWAQLGEIQVLPTFHPAALLRNPDLKRDVWTDMKLLKTLLPS